MIRSTKLIGNDSCNMERAGSLVEDRRHVQNESCFVIVQDSCVNIVRLCYGRDGDLMTHPSY